MKRGAIYTRESERDSDESTSTDRQIKMDTDWLISHGYTLRPEDIFVEPKGYHSGRGEGARPEWKRLKKTIHESAQTSDPVMMLVATKSSRFARNFSLFFEFLSFLDTHKCKWAFVLEPGLNADSPQGKLMLGMTAVINQYFSDSLSDEQKKNFAFFKSRGAFVGKVPFGMRSTGKNTERRLEASTDKTCSKNDKPRPGLELVREWLSLYVSANQIGVYDGAVALNARGWKRDGKKVTAPQLAYILENVTAGYYNEVIDRDLLRRVVARIAERKGRKRNSAKLKAPPPLLWRLLVCPDCGETYHFGRQTQKGIENVTYRHRAGHCPSAHSYSTTRLNAEAIDLVRRLLIVKDSDRREIAERIALESRKSTEAGRREQLETKLKRLKSDLFREMLDSDKIDRAQYDREIDATERELERLRSIPAPRVLTVQDAMRQLADFATLIERVEKLDGFLANTMMRDIFKSLFVRDGHIVDYELIDEIKPFTHPRIKPRAIRSPRFPPRNFARRSVRV